MTSVKGLCSAFCLLLVAAVPLWVLTGGLRRWFRRRMIEEAGLSEALLPTQDDRATHLPRDEATLRELDLGPNTKRIVELFHHGQLARGRLLEHDMIETPIGPNSRTVDFFCRYGWYDLKGVFHEHRSDDRRSGLLNHQFEPKRGDIFLVGYQPGSKDHVIFYADGGARLAAPPPFIPPAPPSQPKPVRPPTDLASIDALLRTAHEQFDDLEALHVLADRLCELNEPRGELMALQLARTPGQAPRPEELQLIAKHSAAWVPSGLDPRQVRFERGFLVAGTCLGSVDPTHLAWQTIEALRFRDPRPEPFHARVPRLKELRGVEVASLQAMLALLPRGLEVLEVRDAEHAELERLLAALREFTALHTLNLQSLRATSAPVEVLELVLRQRPARLTHVWVPAYGLDALDVQRRLQGAPGLVVHLFFDGFGTDPGADRTWVEVTAKEFTLHQLGAPHRGDLILARQVMTACGIADPKVYSQPL